MYVEVLALQFGGGGHPVSARSGAIYQRELSQEDTAGALPRRDRTRVDGGQLEVAAIFDSAPVQAFVNHCTPTPPPLSIPSRETQIQYLISTFFAINAQQENSRLIPISSLAVQLRGWGGGGSLGVESFRPNLRSAVFL